MNSTAMRLDAKRLVSLLAAELLVGAVLLWTMDARASGPKTSSLKAGAAEAVSPPSDATNNERLREGSELKECRGVFRPAGNRVAFFSDEGPARMVVLENLSLERVLRVVESSPVELRWDIAGTVTEYRGVNYLFLRRAVVLGASSSP